MILAQQIYMLVRNELVAAGITAYSDMVSAETAYPFVMYEIPDMADSPDWAFEKDYETLTVRFNVFSNQVNPSDAVALAEQIEDLFNRTKLSFVESEGGIKLVCNSKVNDEIRYLEEDHYWQVISDYEFVAQRNINEDADSSSSGV